MSDSLSEKDWELLLSRIKSGKCTPFLGAGACYPILPLAKEIANGWKEKYKYPMEDIDDLDKVSQFLAIIHDDAGFPKDEVSKLLRKRYPEDFKLIDETHGLIASMDLSVYITTNYDDFMSRALQVKKKTPKRVVCQWNNYLKKHLKTNDFKDFILEDGFEGSRENPIIFHLHGVIEIPESLVLTEDDYVDFLVNISKEKESLIPPRIERALTGSSLLFIGYSLKDWSFRVIFRGLVKQMEDSLRKVSIAVQLDEDDKDRKDYLNKYFANMNVKVYWGKASSFIEDLKKRWEAYNVD